jgi:hypothetical protein
MPWKPDKLLKAILIWTAISLILIWLPLVRGFMEGDSYEWRNSLWGVDIGGHGMHGHYWILVVQGYTASRCSTYAGAELNNHSTSLNESLSPARHLLRPRNSRVD